MNEQYTIKYGLLKSIVIITFLFTIFYIFDKKRQVGIPLGLIRGNDSKVKLSLFGGESLEKLII